MKNALKCVFEMLDLVQNWEIGTPFSKKILKKVPNRQIKSQGNFHIKMILNKIHYQIGILILQMYRFM